MALTRGDRCVHAARAVARAETGSGGEPQLDRRRRQPQARPAPSCAVDAGRQGSRRGAPRVGTWWTRHRHVASALLCKERFTDWRFHRTDVFSRGCRRRETHPPGWVSRKNHSFSDLPGSRGSPPNTEFGETSAVPNSVLFSYRVLAGPPSPVAVSVHGWLCGWGLSEGWTSPGRSNPR